MNAEKQSKEIVSRVMEGTCSSKPMGFEDHRATFILQRKNAAIIQRGVPPFIASLLLPLLVDVFSDRTLDHQAQEDPLDRIADELGISRELLDERLRNGLPEVNDGQFTEYEKGNEIDSSKMNLMYDPAFHRRLVPSFLTEGLGFKLKTTKLHLLFERINNLNFTYSGSCYHDSGFYTHKGDCQTLAFMFLEAADVAGVSNVKIENRMKPMLIDPKPIHGRNETFNTLGDPYWFFKEHYWCTYGNQVYDMLFMEEKEVAFYALVKEEIITPDPPEGDTEGKPLDINVELYSNGCYVYHDENARKVFVAKDKHGIVEYVGNQKEHP